MQRVTHDSLYKDTLRRSFSIPYPEPTQTVELGGYLCRFYFDRLDNAYLTMHFSINYFERKQSKKRTYYLQVSSFIIKWAVTCDFQQCGILTSVDTDVPVQPPFKLRNSKWCSVSSLTLIKAKALIRLRVCAGWSEPLLVAQTTLLEISCHGLIVIQTLGASLRWQAELFIPILFEYWKCMYLQHTGKILSRTDI